MHPGHPQQYTLLQSLCGERCEKMLLWVALEDLGEARHMSTREEQ